ncbi:hypothetical protein FOZ63_007804, partial [Perkinsus olseni]
PKASNKKRDTCVTISSLRSSMKKNLSAKQYDLSKAFYRLAIAHPVVIDFGENPTTGRSVMMRCSRLAFGLSIGPAGLEFSLNRLFEILRSFHPSVTCIRIMDDIVAIGLYDDLVKFEKDLLCLCGFDVPPNKMNSWSGESWSRWLGCDCKWDGSQLLVKVPNIDYKPITTKRQAFSEAGKYLRLCESIPGVKKLKTGMCLCLPPPQEW